LLNIVIVNDSATINGGAAKVALTEAKALAECGHKVHLLCGAGPIAADLASTRNLVIHQLDIPDINVDPSRIRAMSLGLWNPGAHRFTQELLLSLDATQTVVHAHSWTRALTSSVLQAALESRCSVVLTLHDYLMGCPQGTFFQQRKGCPCTLVPMGISCLASNCDTKGYTHKLWRAGRKFVQDKVSGAPRNIRNFIYLSNASLNQLKPYLPPDANYYRLPNPIDVQRLTPAAVERSDIFCFAGRFVPEKGALLFAQAAQAQAISARFIGDGPQRDQIVRIMPSAQMSGWMNSWDLSRALRDARALIFPSVWNEVLGLTVLEAAAQGVPSIVPKGCGAEESVLDGITGLHFESGNASDLEAKISMLKDPVFAAKLGREAYETFWSTKEWTMAKHIENLEAIYGEILEKRQS
jgi:glycosyltransferase involved in cell wall biosynthesis